jgi:hypothetical protein
MTVFKALARISHDGIILRAASAGNTITSMMRSTFSSIAQQQNRQFDADCRDSAWHAPITRLAGVAIPSLLVQHLIQQTRAG